MSVPVTACPEIQSDRRGEKRGASRERIGSGHLLQCCRITQESRETVAHSFTENFCVSGKFNATRPRRTTQAPDVQLSGAQKFNDTIVRISYCTPHN